MGRYPVSGEPLGRAFPEYAPVNARVAARVAGVSTDLADEQRTAAVTKIEAEEPEAGGRRAVAGYDFTFSVPHSPSVADRTHGGSVKGRPPSVRGAGPGWPGKVHMQGTRQGRYWACGQLQCSLFASASWRSPTTYTALLDETRQED